ncbi:MULTISPECIES: N-acyl amino acid synthase FeeM domain-containing protein [unclassified Rhizobium]|uniref:N-acyl amino acid synthase FeeM domain-containing protein n=1 Tax=unclassified Rhizobium TaxID=2613769 RepID=UPI00380EBB8A
MTNMSALQNSFAGKLMEVLDHVEYRRIESSEDMEDVARLRYKAYKARSVLPVAAKNLIDDIDFDDHAYIFGVYYYEELVSTVRIHHVTPDHRVCQSTGIFPDEIHAFLDAGMSLIDPARFAVDPDLELELPALPYLTLRPAIVGAIYFDTDRVMQHIRPAHAAFYKRVFYADTVVPPRMTKTYGFELTLLASRSKEIRGKLMKRYPFFDSEPYERRMMFSRSKDNSSPPLTILPTARLASGGRREIHGQFG